MNTAAKEVYYDVDNINAKKESFDHFETNEATLWRSIAAAKQGSTDYLELQKSHKESVKLMDAIVTYFEKYTEPTTDPTAIASGSTATSTALGQAQRVQRPAFGYSMAPHRRLVSSMTSPKPLRRRHRRRHQMRRSHPVQVRPPRRHSANCSAFSALHLVRRCFCLHCDFASRAPSSGPCISCFAISNQRVCLH